MHAPATTLVCPKCQAPMRSYERSGVTVDQCSECRGIFLDRGELERLTDAERAHEREPAAFEHEPAERGRGDRDSHGDPRKRRKRGFFGELFDD